MGNISYFNGRMVYVYSWFKVKSKYNYIMFEKIGLHLSYKRRKHQKTQKSSINVQ